VAFFKSLRRINPALVSVVFPVILACSFPGGWGAWIGAKEGGKVFSLASSALARKMTEPGFQKAAKRSALKWTPPNVDAPISTLTSTQACPLSEVLGHAGERATELVANLQSFTARESVEYADLDYNGPNFGSAVGTAMFDYAVSFDQKPGALAVHETRSPSRGSSSLPGEFQSSGLVTIGLVFHPYYQGDFEMRCEGMDQWNGEAAWVVHFQQRDDKPARMHSLRSSDSTYRASLKGRGWISTDTSQILHIETNLKKEMPAIQLQREAISVDYAPVEFHSMNIKLWLPQVSEVFFVWQDRRYVILHAFTNFLVSSVQTQQPIGEPNPK
jgi:hypothetical protein